MGRYTKEQTHRIMSGVHSKDTNIEVALRKELWNRGYHYRKNVKSLPGKPDIVFTKYKIAIFCDAEFWHGKDWEIQKPKLEAGKNPDFWVNKIEKNHARDNDVDVRLRSMGWTVIRFWGKEILDNVQECVKVIEETIFEIKLNDDECK